MGYVFAPRSSAQLPYVYSVPLPSDSQFLVPLLPTHLTFPLSVLHFIMAPSATHSNAAPDGTRPGDVHRSYLDDRSARAEGSWQICLSLVLAELTCSY